MPLQLGYAPLAACLLALLALPTASAFSGVGCLAPAFGPRSKVCSVNPQSSYFSQPSLVQLPGPMLRGSRIALSMASEPSESEEEERLRNELAGLLGSTGREKGMKKLKAPKGSIEALRQQAASPKPEASPPPASPPTAASPSSPPEAVPKPIAPPPRPKQPEPTYEDLDALLKGSAPRAPAPSPAPAPSGPMPTLSRPSYEVGGGSGVSMPAFDKGDRVPMEGWDVLVDTEGQTVSTAQFSGTPFLLIVPEPAHHTGAPTDTWCRLLVDLKEKLGSQRADLSILAISPEPTELHVKMQKKWGFKFTLASDPDRTLLAKFRLWNPEAAARGVTIDRQSFLIDTSTWKFAEVFRSVGVAGHGETVKAALESRAAQAPARAAAEAALTAAPPAVVAPPLRPVVEEKEEEEVKAEEGKKEKEEEKKKEEEEEEKEEAAAVLMQPLVRPTAVQAARKEEPKVVEEDGEEVFPVPSENVGSLIGYRGTRVKQLTQLSGATCVKFEKDPSRMVVIGTELARAKALQIATEWMQSIEEDTHPLAASLHGKMIGVGGEHVKAIQAQSGAKIRFQQEPEPCMIIRGTPEERAKAFELSQKYLQDGPPDGEVIKLMDELDDPTIRDLIGYRGAVVKELEEKTGARIRFDFENRQVMIMGSEKQRSQAKAAIIQIQEASANQLEGVGEERFELAEGDQRRLVGPGGSKVRELEANSGARLTMTGARDGEKAAVLIKGTAEQRAKAWELAQAVLEEDVETHEVPMEYHRLIIGPGGSNVRKIEEESGARIISIRDDSQPRFQLRGSQEQRQKAWAGISELMKRQESPLILQLNERSARQLLAGRAAALKEIESQTGSSITVVKDTERRVKDAMVFEIRGMPDQQEHASKLLTEYSQNAVGSETFLLAELVGESESGAQKSGILNLRRLIGPRGARIHQLEESTGALVKLQQEPEPRITVTGSAEARKKVLDIVTKELSELEDERVPVDAVLHGSLIGVGGRTIQRLEEESGAQISFQTLPEAVMILRGTLEQREAAKRLTKEILDGDDAETLVVPLADQTLLIGPNGRNVRDVEQKSGARVQVLTPGNRAEVLKQNPSVVEVEASMEKDHSLIIVRGTETERKIALKILRETVKQDGIEEVAISSDQARYLRSGMGLRCRDIEASTGARLRISTDPPSISVRGGEAQREEAKAQLRLVLEEEEEERVLPGKHALLTVRLIIGQGGSKVKELELEAGARIHFDTKQEVKMLVRGSKEARDKAWALVDELRLKFGEESFPLNKEKHYIVIGARGDTVRRLEVQTGSAITFTVDPEPAMVVQGNETARALAWKLAQEVLAESGEVEQGRYTIDAQYHAVLIGANGNRVKKIEKETGARIQFQRNDNSGVCLVTGTAAQREAAYQMMLSIIEDEEEERFPIPAEFHRMLIGARGATVKWMEEESASAIGFESEPEGVMVVRGTKEAREKALELAKQVMSSEEEEQFYVEHRYHGFLIGPQGSTVKELETKSNTRIQMSEDEPIVMVRGSSENRDAAWELIQSKMDEYDEGRPSSGRGEEE